jgi:2-iminobutanoate/2-iminopropanoate deaminase
MKEVIFTDKATSPTGPYSQAVKVGNTVYLAGVCGDDPATGEIMGNGDMKIEAKYALENLKNTIEAAGGKMSDIVMVHVVFTDVAQAADFNEVYRTYFPDYLPARIAMGVAALLGGANLELDAIAVLED